MPNKKTQLFHALLWTAIITVLSLVTLGDVGGDVKIPYKDKMVHFVFYFVFVLLWFRYRKTPDNNARTAFSVAVFAILYGLLMEACQSLFTANRTADLYDAMANSSGALAALLLICYNFLKKRKI